MFNQYISKEEFQKTILNLDTVKQKDIAEVCSLIYNEGYRVKDAFVKVSTKKTSRAFEKAIKKASQGLFTLSDLRRAYFLNNPHLLYKRLQAKRRYNPISARLRWKILQRDNFRCCACGVSSNETKLHVDHITPKSKGGSEQESNLRTLCALCNMGKSDRLPVIEVTKVKPWEELF